MAGIQVTDQVSVAFVGFLSAVAGYIVKAITSARTDGVRADTDRDVAAAADYRQLFLDERQRAKEDRDQWLAEAKATREQFEDRLAHVEETVIRLEAALGNAHAAIRSWRDRASTLEALLRANGVTYPEFIEPSYVQAMAPDRRADIRPVVPPLL